MDTKLLLVSITTVLSLLGGMLLPGLPSVAGPAYVEPGLALEGSQPLSVIIAATNAQAAASAVEAVGGEISSELWLIDSVAASVPAERIKALAAQAGVAAITANRDVRTASDVTPTDDRKVYALAYPTTIDVGADLVHNTLLTEDRTIRGHGVTVAVIDSGVYFDGDVGKLLGPQVAHLFKGQADFADPVCETTTAKNKKPVTLGTQYDDYCFQSYEHSRDPFGHGTAVAGVIWNHFTDAATGVTLGIAPDGNVLSIRVLDDTGYGTYERIIQGIQYAVANRDAFGLRVLNLSLSAPAVVPYFVDPLNRAAEEAWAAGLVVLAAAGNDGPAAETISVPGNDPYVITVGAVDGNRTAANFGDDVVPAWSAAGPTQDGFAKPDVVAPGANVVTFMYNDPSGANTQTLVRLHPDYSETANLFRMNGTSLSTAVTSGVVALMLQAHPELTPDQVKYRLMHSAYPAVSADGELVYNTFQQGLGRVWAPDAVLGSFDPAGAANQGMDLAADLAHGYETDADLAFHYQGPVQKIASEDGSAYLYYAEDGVNPVLGLAGVWADGLTFMDAAAAGKMVWAGGKSSSLVWAGGLSWSGDPLAFSSARMTWAGGKSSTWEAWSTARMTWAGGKQSAYAWNGGLAGASARMTWAGGKYSSLASATIWIGD